MIIPAKLEPGDEIRVIAPARSLSLLGDGNIRIAQERLEGEGFKVTFSKNCREMDMFVSSSVQSRVEDLHEAFADQNVKGILTVIGGFNSNQLLKYIDYDLIRRNPKILCGYSDITALCNAITAKTGLITYSGPHFSTWGMKKEFDYNLEYSKKCLMSESEFTVETSETWSDDRWYLDQDNRNLIPNPGYEIIQKGQAEGKILGGNLCTFNLLHGTEYMPDLSGSILFLEDDGEINPHDFDRDLQSVIHQPNFDKVQGLVIGRFQKETNINMEQLRYIIETKAELKDLPVVANVDFGHTNPMITFPIGGRASLVVGDEAELKIIKH
jgi:muramoyltetrapeptide carboxypeptidase